MKFNKISLTTRIIFASISSALIIPISYLEMVNSAIVFGVSLINMLIGATFALLVMVPFQAKLNLLKTVLMVLASIAIYSFTSKLAITNYQLFSLNLSHSTGVSVSGSIGAILTGLSIAILAPLKLRSLAYLVLAVVGLVAGYVFSFTIHSNSIYINAIGFITWQIGVCATVFLSKE